MIQNSLKNAFFLRAARLQFSTRVIDYFYIKPNMYLYKITTAAILLQFKLIPQIKSSISDYPCNNFCD